VIAHDDNIIGHQPQRHGDARQCIKMDLQPEQIIKDHRDAQVPDQHHQDQQNMSDLPCHQKNKNEQNQKGTHRP